MVDPFVLVESRYHDFVPLQPAPDVVVLISHPPIIHGAAVFGAVCLRNGPDEAKHDDDGGKRSMRHEDRLAPLSCLSVPPVLPVLPRGIVRRGALLVAPASINVAQRCDAVAVRPAQAVGVVHAAFGGVAEELVGGDDDAVSFEAGGVGELANV